MYPKRSVDGYRSLPHKWPFIEAAILTLLQYLMLITVITLGAILIRIGETQVKIAFIAAVIALAVIWLIGYIRRATIKCPLCKGTPLLDNAASKHKKAFRFRPLNYGATAQFSLLLGHRFSCMYCGTGFDLMRKSSKIHHRSNDQ